MSCFVKTKTLLTLTSTVIGNFFVLSIHSISVMWRILFPFVIIKYGSCFSASDLIKDVFSAVVYNAEILKEHTYCNYVECCSGSSIPANIEELERNLTSNLYGQHLVIDQLIPALRAHFTNLESSKKPLVISFHGMPGTGKNYVTDFIAKSIYEKGLDSKFVVKFVGRSDFPVESKTDLYKEIINNKVRETAGMCSTSLFIFDEVDKMPRGVFESITSLLDHHAHIGGVNFRKSIFIFLSNTAGVEIMQKLSSMMKAGVLREHTVLSDFEKILERTAYSVEGGLKKSSIIEAHLVDHFIPFLPLEKSHIFSCIVAEYKRLGVIYQKDNSVRNLIDKYVTFDKDTGLFATTGCKRLSKKVEVDVFG